MAAKFSVITTPIAPICQVYLAKPDDVAPEGASWKPNGRFKATLVLDLQQLATIRKEFVKVLMATYPKADPDGALFPWRDGATEDKEGNPHPHAGKMLFKMQSSKMPECYDGSGRTKLTPEKFPKYNDECRFKVALIPFDKEENVQVVEGGRRKTEKVKVYGVSARIYGVQLVHRNSGGGGFDAVDGGFEASGEDTEHRADEDRPSGKSRRTEADDISEDEIPF